MKKLTYVLLCFSVFFLFSCVKEDGQEKTSGKTIILKTPVAFNTSLPSLGNTIIYVSDFVKGISGGSLEVKYFEPGKLVKPFEILDAVSSGKVEAGYATPGYWAGKMPAAPLFAAIPFGPEAPEYLAWFHHGGGLQLQQRMYDENGFNVKVLQCGMSPPETSGWFEKPITSPSDFKGLKIRFFGLGGKVVENLGAAVQLLPGGEIFPALEKKVLNASEFSLPAVDTKLGFYKIVKYNYFPGWHQQATNFEFLVNKDVWNDLSEQHQKTLEVACKAATLESLAQGEADQFPVLKKNAEERGVIIKKWSPKMLKAFRDSWEEVLKEQKKDPFFAEVYEHLETFRKGYDLWESNAFLPRK